MVLIIMNNKELLINSQIKLYEKKLVLNNRLEFLIELRNSREIEIVGEKPENFKLNESEIYNQIRTHHLDIDPIYTLLSRRISYFQDKIINIEQEQILFNYSKSFKIFNRIYNFNKNQLNPKF